MPYTLTPILLADCRFQNIREHLGDEEELRLLGESLKARQTHPILVRSDATVIDGERRVRAGLLAGLEKLLAIVTDEDLTPEQIAEIQFVSAFHRSDLTGYEKWKAVLAIREAYPDAPIKDLAARLQIDPKMVKVLLSPSDCIPEAQQALRDRKIGISDCYNLSLLPLEEQPALLTLKLCGASRDDLARQGRRRRSGSAPSVRTSRIKCLLPSGITISVSGDSLGMDDFIEALSEAQKEARKARDQNLDVRTWQSVMRDRAKAAV